MPRLGYRPELEAVRGLAILLVLAAHLATLFPDVSGLRLYSGFIGVDLFFVLSGFLITTLMLEERTRTGSFAVARFYGRRALRLFPVLLVGIAIAGIAAIVAGRNGPGMPLHEAALWVIACIANWSDRSLGFLAHTWALGVEEQYYLVWPAVLLGALERKVRLRTVATTLVVGAFAVAIARVFVLHGDGSTQQVWGALRADGVMLGSALAVMLAADHERLTRWLRDRRVVVVAVAVLASYVAYVEIGGRWGRAAFTKDLLVLATLAMCVLVGSLVVRRVSVASWCGPLCWLGRMSYAMFLVHYPVFGVLARTGPQHPLLRLAVALAVTFAVSFALHRAVERPALKLKDRAFGRREEAPREDARVAA